MINKRGDTIIEVMIAIIVIGLALGSAFAISNRSTKQTQANHERFQAQLYANEKAELLKKDYSDHLATPGNNRGNYDPGASPIAELKDCYDAVGCSPTSGPQNYNIVIADEAGGAVDASVTPKSYKITVTWDSFVNTGEKERVEIWYGL